MALLIYSTSLSGNSRQIFPIVKNSAGLLEFSYGITDWQRINVSEYASGWEDRPYPEVTIESELNIRRRGVVSQHTTQHRLSRHEKAS